ncbi:hypothetical protein DV735_g2145, partial [Chaetothyriales sp. CBS 134920]
MRILSPTSLSLPCLDVALGTVRAAAVSGAAADQPGATSSSHERHGTGNDSVTATADATTTSATRPPLVIGNSSGVEVLDNLVALPWTGYTNERLSMPLEVRGPLLLLASFITGMGLGGTAAGQMRADRYRAENAHRYPTSEAGWYLYQRSKNYHLFLGAISGGARSGVLLSLWGAGFMATEEGIDQLRARLLHRPDGQRDFLSTVVAALALSGVHSRVHHMNTFATVKSSKMALKAGLAFGLAQDALALMRGGTDARRLNRTAPHAGTGTRPIPPSAEVALVRDFDLQFNPSRPSRGSPLAASSFQGMPLDLIDRIRSFPLFQSTPDSFLAELVLVLKPQMFSAQATIVTEGQDAKAMYWLARGAVAVTSRDGESTYAELRSGSFFGEIGILLEMPRTASVVARTKCLVLVLKKEDLQTILPRYPYIENAIRDEALERLAQTQKKKQQIKLGTQDLSQLELTTNQRRGSKRLRDMSRDDDDGLEVSDSDQSMNGSTNKRRKSPSPGMHNIPQGSALGHGLVNIRATLKELPLFANMPTEMLHFLGLNAQPRTFPPFTDILKQDTVGRDVYFLVRGQVEVVHEPRPSKTTAASTTPTILARLKPGQYFGEVASLALADRRTATVRSVTQVECLMVSEHVLAQCPLNIKQQIAETAMQRLRLSAENGNDIIMSDVDPTPDMDELVITEPSTEGQHYSFHQLKERKPPSHSGRVTFHDPGLAERPHAAPAAEDAPIIEPFDPDPLSTAALDNVRARSRRSSLAPPVPDHMQHKEAYQLHRPSRQSAHTFVARDRSQPKRHKSSLSQSGGILPDSALLRIFPFLPLRECMRLQAVCQHWQHLLSKDPSLFKLLDLSAYNREVTDELLANTICPFIGTRPEVIDISNCFHITDKGFNALASLCGPSAKIWRMKSVWDVTAPAILEMANRAKGLTQIDLSNCRKVSDTLLARIVGWVVPAQQQQQPAYRQHVVPHRLKTVNGQHAATKHPASTNSSSNSAQSAAPGTVFGCPELKSICLSYCKHITDRSMHHIANYAADRIEEIDLTRCTTISDSGFQYWGHVRFEKLRRLCLADCTYLTDQAIVWLVNGAGNGLRELDLSFCCALSDTATEVLALGCPNLTSLNMSFCGSAISDPSLRSISLHLTALTKLAVRGCVRVTGAGVESIIDGCKKLQVLDVSQCKNLIPWLDRGGVARTQARGRNIYFEVVSSGSKLVRGEKRCHLAAALLMDSAAAIKRPYATDDDSQVHVAKRLKAGGGGPNTESPAVYSEQVKKKLAAASRTGQACDRCKERKMKCDADPVACQPCRSKNLRCFTTDRVTGQARERGQSDRTENELAYLQSQLHLYQQKYGPLMAVPEPALLSRYIGWPFPLEADQFRQGPVHGTRVNIFDAVIDVADFESDPMRDPRPDEPDLLNASRSSIFRSIFHFRPVPPPEFPSLQEALQSVDIFLLVLSQYAPVLHRPSIKAVVMRYYEQPDSISRPELMQFTLLQAILSQQSATRNAARWEDDYRKAHHYFHFALSLYRQVYTDSSLEAMQALSLLCLYLRVLPQPGESWSFSQKVLLRLLELQYHRNPNKIALPANENNPLAKEMRIRVFHSILTICVLTGCRAGLAPPLQFQFIDVPLPSPLKDEEISPAGIVPNPSGLCDFRPCLQLSKLLPLTLELQNNITTVRRPPAEYVKVVEALNTKILAWRQDWDISIKNEPRTPPIEAATFLMDHCAAEFQITLHHPVCCTSTAPEVLDRNLDICHAAAKKLLQSFHYLNREFKSVDFTCHSLVAYAMGFGIALHVYRKKLARVSKEKFENICNELSGWVSVMAYFDLVLRTGYLLQGIFRTRVQQLEEDYRKLLLDTPTTAAQPAGGANGFPAHMVPNGLLSPLS